MISSCPSAQGAEGDIPHASKHPPPNLLFATSWKISGKARLVTLLGLEEVIYLVIYVWVFVNTSRIRIWERIWSLVVVVLS